MMLPDELLCRELGDDPYAPRRRRKQAREDISEARWQREVIRIAEAAGWRWYHTHDSRRSPAGFPDLVLLRGEQLIFAELKSDTGRIRPEQQEWLAALGAAAEVHVWRPTDRPAVVARLTEKEG